MYPPILLTGLSLAFTMPLVGGLAAPAWAASQPAAGDAWGLSVTMLAAVAGSAGLAATVCSGLSVVILGRRRDRDRPVAALDDVEAAQSRLAAVANRAARAQESTAEAAEMAMTAAQDAAKTMARLVALTTETQDRLRDWLANADKNQEKAATLASQCGKLTEILPELLGGAIESMQTRGLAGLEAAASALQNSLAETLEAEAARTEAATAAQQRQAELTREFGLIFNNLPEILAGALSGITANHHALLGQAADRLVAQTMGLEAAAASVAEGVNGLTLAAAAQAACQTSAAQLAAQCERLAHELPGSLAAAVRTTADIDRAATELAADRLREGADFMQAASAALRDSVANLVRAEADHGRAGRQIAALAEQSALLCEELPQRADAAIGAIESQAKSALELVELRWQDSTLGIEAAAASLHDGVRAIGEATQVPAERLEAALARVEQVGQALPEIGGQLARQASELQQETLRDMEMLQDAAASSAQTAKLCGEAVAQATEDTSRVLANLVSSQNAAFGLAAKLEALVEELPREFRPIAGFAAIMQSHVDQLGAAAGQIESAAHTAMASADACGRILPQIDDQLANRVAGLCAAAERGAQMLAHAAQVSEQANEVCGASLDEASRQLQAVLEDMAETQQTTSAIAAQADAALGALPLEAGLIAAAATALREDAGGLCAAAWQIEGASARQADALAARLEAPAGTIEALSAQLEATLRGGADRLAETGAALRAQLVAEAGSLARRVDDAARDLVATARHDAQKVDDSAWRESAAILAAQLDRIGTLYASGEQSASRLALAAEAVEAPRIDPRLAHLESAIAQVSAAASQLASRAEAQDQVATRVYEAALAVAAAATPPQVAAANVVEDIPTLARMTALAAEAQALQTAAAEFARSAVHGNPASLPPEIARQAPAILASIETSIQGLRGTATAIAIAADAARIAA